MKIGIAKCLITKQNLPFRFLAKHGNSVKPCIHWTKKCQKLTVWTQKIIVTSYFKTSQAGLFSLGSCIHPSFLSDWLIGNMWDVKPEYLDSTSPEITFKSSEFSSIRLSDLGQLIIALICLKNIKIPSNIKLKLNTQD